MKNTFKVAAVSLALAAATLSFGVVMARSLHQTHGQTAHGQKAHGQSSEHMAAFMQKLELSPFQMVLVHLVQFDYTHLEKGAKDDAAKKVVHLSQHGAMSRAMTPAQQEKAIAEMIKMHPEAKDQLKPGPSLVKELAVMSAGQKEKFAQVHEKLHGEMGDLKKAMHEGHSSAEMHDRVHAVVAEITALMNADQKREWNAVLAYVAAEKKRLKG